VTHCLGNRRAYRGVSIPAQHVSRQSAPCLGHAQPSYPHLMRLLGWCPAEGLLPLDTWQSWPSCRFLNGTWRHRTSSPGGREVRAPEAGPGAQAHKGLAPTRGGTGPPRGVRCRWRPFLSTLSSRGTWRRQTCKSTGEPWRP
jgi:hypothetical protein